MRATNTALTKLVIQTCSINPRNYNGALVKHVWITSLVNAVLLTHLFSGIMFYHSKPGHRSVALSNNVLTLMRGIKRPTLTKCSLKPIPSQLHSNL